jgi:hypothetical protein
VVVKDHRYMLRIHERGMRGKNQMHPHSFVRGSCVDYLAILFILTLGAFSSVDAPRPARAAPVFLRGGVVLALWWARHGSETRRASSAENDKARGEKRKKRGERFSEKGMNDDMRVKADGNECRA